MACYHHPETMDHVREFLAGGRTIDLQIRTRPDAYSCIEETARRFDYAGLGKAEKGILRQFLGRVTGLSRAQVTRLLRQYRVAGRLTDHRQAPRRPFSRRYTTTDVELLAEVDALHGTLSGPATRRLCARACHLFGDDRFERLAGISNGHLYNLRRSTAYRRRRGAISSSPTCPVATGRRWRPQPFGEPGHLRVVAVRHGDMDGLRGLCHLELVDEVTRFQLVASVERPDASCLEPLFDALPGAFPFTVRGFHHGDGSGRGAREVAALLQALHVEQTSRACRSTGNTFTEAGTGAVAPRYLRNGCVSSGHTRRVNAFTRKVLSPFLNYHGFHFFPTVQVDAMGRVHKRYRAADVMTPYERLRSLPGAAAYLTPGTTFEQLDALATAMSDCEAAHSLNEAGIRLFRFH